MDHILAPHDGIERAMAFAIGTVRSLIAGVMKAWVLARLWTRPMTTNFR